MPYSIQKSQNHFSETYKKFLQSQKNKNISLYRNTFELIQSYEFLTSAFYRLRFEKTSSDPIRQRVEDNLAHFTQSMLALQKTKNEKWSYKNFVREYRRAWRENISLFWFTVILFLGSIFLGWQITMINSYNALAFAPQDLLEDVLKKYAWFEEINISPFFEGLSIAWNNIQVSFNCFLFGALLGLGGIYILTYNGFLLGSLFAFCYIHNFHEQLFRFVTGHGALELSIIVCAAFSGFLLGRVFYMRPYKLFRIRMAEAAHHAKHIIFGVLPWLLLAGFVESFISPSRHIPFSFKVLVSIFIAALFWIWTFWPNSQEEEKT